MTRQDATTRQGPAGQMPYLPALDGLRAIAVTGVLLYHAGLGASGGFLGVESFFVLSGFLITALLLAEWDRSGGIDLPAFWMRRARRLLPALFVLLAGTLALGALLAPDESAELGAHTLAALGYVTNWHLIATQQSYFDATARPPLLQHLWSLAVEEQFYLIWPLLFAMGMRRLGRRGLLIATLAGAGASAALMAALFEPGADPSRVYYGTDTRAAGLLLGAALAMVWSPGAAPLAARRTAGPLLDAAGLAALAGLAVAYARLSEQNPLLYTGGFALVALGTAAVIAASTHPRARALPLLLGCGPLRWVGQRSYGIYLWHWPIFMLSRPGVDVPLDGPALVALQLGATVLLAALSYRFVETPVRQGVLAGAWLRLRSRRAPQADASLDALALRASAARRRHDARRSIAGLDRRLVSAASISVLLLSSTTCAPRATTATRPAAASTVSLAAAPRNEAGGTRSGSLLARSSALAPRLAPPATPAPTAAPDPTAAPATPVPDETPAAPAPAPLDPELAAALQQVLDETVDDGYIPGATVAVYVPGHETWLGASGVSDRRAQTPMEPGTHVRIASISKMFTAVVMLQLAQGGVIDLDAPVSTWLPGLVPSGEATTVRQLLQHTSGLYDYLEDRSFVNRAYRTPGRAYQPRELVEYAAQFPLSFRPGAKGAWDYSSTNYVMLGMIVEQATGNTLAHEIRARIFEPLGLRETFFTPVEAVDGVMARGYSKSTDQTAAPMSAVFATGSLVSTAEDLQRFARGLFGGELLAPETLEQMLSFVGGKGQYNMPELEYGLGVMRNRLPVGEGLDGAAHPREASRVLGHIGGFGGFRAALWYGQDNGIVVALGVNQASTDPNTLATRLFDTVLDYGGALER